MCHKLLQCWDKYNLTNSNKLELKLASMTVSTAPLCYHPCLVCDGVNSACTLCAINANKMDTCSPAVMMWQSINARHLIMQSEICDSDTFYLSLTVESKRTWPIIIQSLCTRQQSATAGLLCGKCRHTQREGLCRPIMLTTLLYLL